jgi:hypothetical protein
MALTKLTTSEKNKPIKKVKAGRFQISLWKFRRLLTSGSPDSTAYHEQWVDVDRVCIQHSTFNRATNQRKNQDIWCAPGELRNLVSVLDKIGEGEDSSLPSRSCERWSR